MQRSYLFSAGILLFLAALISTGCENTVSSIPDRDVYLKRNLTTSKLDPQGAYLYIVRPEFAVDRIGFGGILIMHAFDDAYYAVDLACPHEVDASVRISPPDDSGMCTCDSCGEVYNMTFGQGNPTKGIAKEPLRRYSVFFDDADNILVSR